MRLAIAKPDMDAGVINVPRLTAKVNLGAKPRGEAIAELLQSMRERRAPK